MALYTVSSSGALKIADTGLNTPVSFFTPEGIATGAVADGPLAGNNSRVYIIDGQGNRYQSSGQLIVTPGDFIDGGNALAATSLGELPLGGGSNFYTGTSVVKAFVTAAAASNGQLRLSGSSVSIIARRIETTGNLTASGTVTQLSKRLELSNTGQLRVTGNKVAPSLRQFDSSGQFKLFPVDAYRIILVESTTNQLKLTGASAYGLKYDSIGQLSVNGSTATPGITLQPTSTGLISVTTEWYTVNRIGGLATEALASSPVAAGTDPIRSILNTTKIGSYSITGRVSTGQLVVTPIGTAASDLSQDGTIAGSPLATNSFAERRYNPDRTQFRQLQNIDSAGVLKFDISVKYRVDSEPAALVFTGQAGYNNDRQSSGNLVAVGSDSNTSLRIELSSGSIRLRATGENPLALDSGLAGSPLAALPLAGGNDSITGTTKFSSLRIESTSGQLKLSGVAGVGLKRLSSGQIVSSGSVITSSLRTENTSGQLRLTSTLATRSIRTERSSGSLTLTNADAFKVIQEEESRGQLRLSGSVVTQSLRLEISNTGQLKLSSTVATRIILAPTSVSSLSFTTVSQNPLTVNTSGLAGSPLASISIAGGFDLPGYATLFSSLRTELTQGTLVTTGTHVNTSRRVELSNTGQLQLSGSVVTSSLRTENTSGQLRLTGTDYNTSRRNELSSGQLSLTGSVVTSSRRNEISTGSLKFYPTDEYRIYMYESSTNRLSFTGTDYNTSTRNELSSGQLVTNTLGQNSLSLSNSLAGSALASLPLSGSNDQIKATFKSLRNELSSGTPVLSGSVVTRSLRLEISNTGQLRLTGSSVARLVRNALSTGQLKLSGSDSNTSRRNELTAGQLQLTGSVVTRSRRNIISTGSWILANADAFKVIQEEESRGQLRLSSNVLTRSIRTEISSGVIKLRAIGENPLTSASSISGSALASLPLSGSIDSLTGKTTFTSFRNELSAGNLIASSTLATRSIRIELTSGNVTLSGSTAWNTTLTRATTGNLVSTGSTAKNITKARITGGNLSVSPNGTNTSLTVSGSIAGSAIADHPIVSNAEVTLLRTQVTYVLNGLFYRDEGLVTISSGRLVLSGQTKNTSSRQAVSSGNLALTGSYAVRIRYAETSSGRLTLTGTTGTSNVNNYAFASSGNLTLVGAHIARELHVELSSGQLYLSGAHTKAITSANSTAGNLLVSGTHTRSELYTETSAGQLYVNGAHAKTFRHNVESIGSVIVAGTTEITTTIGGYTTYDVVSNGSVHVTGSTVSLHIFESLQTSSGRLKVTGQTVAVVRRSLNEETSSGNLVLNGRSVARFIPKPKKRANGGGGYVYASSWDILKPYFPDDRHILGYRDLKTSGTGVVSVSGHTDAVFIPAAKVTVSNRKSLSDYMEEVKTSPKPRAQVKKAKPAPAPVPKISAQAFMEDELLLKGSLLSLDPLQDELDQELL